MSENLRPRAFTDMTRLTRWVRWLSFLLVGLGIFGSIQSLAVGVALLDWAADPEAPLLELVDAITDAQHQTRGSMLVGGAMMLAAVILVLTWTYRANANCRRLGATGMRFRPGWAVGWFFVPVANLWKPYQVMREIWAASRDPDRWQTQAAPAILKWWWGLFLVSLLFAFSPATFLFFDRYDAARLVILIHTAGALASWGQYLVGAAVVSRVHRLQMSHAAVPA